MPTTHTSKCLGAALCAGLWLSVAPGAQAQDQFVVFEATYTATAQNTSDSHYRVSPAPGTPSNWRSPIDYASGTAHVRLEVLEKPSAQKTLYNICYEATPSYACMPYSPAYTAPGLYEFSYPFNAFYQYSMVDWSKGVRQIALILKDENETKKQGDPAFYPTKIHVTITIVRPGGTYVRPTAMQPDAGTPMDAAMPSDASGPSRDSGEPPEEPSAGADAPPQPSTPGSAGAGSAGRGGTAGRPSAGAAALPSAGSLGPAPNAAPSRAGGAAAPSLAETPRGGRVSGGCSAAPDPRASGAPLGLLLWLTATVLCTRRVSRRGPRTREDSDG